jgi:hypothetical protein
MEVMSPLFWGFAGWHFIHAVALGYPHEPSEEIKKAYSIFFSMIPYVLPCPFCGKHFSENMSKNPIRLDNKMELFKWTVEMHNFVNESKGRKQLTVEEAFEEFKKNGEGFKDRSILMNGVTAESLAINDPKVSDFVRKGIEEGIQKFSDLKSSNGSSRFDKILRIVVVGLVCYIIYDKCRPSKSL